MASNAQVAGYLLEEVVVNLLSNSGYRILSFEDDPNLLVEGPNGLRVRGRGADHQADALGDLAIHIPFSDPIRLFVEAKCVALPVGLEVLRNAHGVVHDVNEYVHQTSPSALGGLGKRVQYRYSIFSTSGFTANAQKYGIAHQISLVDLSDGYWSAVSTVLKQAAMQIRAIQIPTGMSVSAAARQALRAALPYRLNAFRPVASPPDVYPPFWAWATSVVDTIWESLGGTDEFLLGFLDAPFILTLKAENLREMKRVIEQEGNSIPVRIYFSRRGPLDEDWVIEPRDGTAFFRLTFPVPRLVGQALLATPQENMRSAAGQFKRQLMSEITVYVDGRAVRLIYDPSETPVLVH